MPPALHACAAKQVVSSPMLLCRARQSPLAESFMQRMHPAKFPARLELYLSSECLVVLFHGCSIRIFPETRQLQRRHLPKIARPRVVGKTWTRRATEKRA